MSVGDLLPPEICYQILTKLPAKSILRFRCVCKTWYSLISYPDFITDHAAQTLNHSTTNRVLVQSRVHTKDLHNFSSHDESFVESHEHDDLPEQLRSGFVRIVGSCDGLVCLLTNVAGANDTQVHSFLIWNPSIRKLVQLPFRDTSPRDDAWYILGFGFDPESGDYKVLRSVYFEFNELGYLATGESEIFDLRKGVWRRISPPMTPPYVEDPYLCVCVYLNGSLHWLGQEDTNDYVLMSFDLSSEVSQEMGMPGGIIFEDFPFCYQCSVLANQGLLSVALLTGSQQDACRVGCTVWSMKESGVTESWTKLLNIEVPYSVNDLELLRFWEDGVLLVSVSRGGPALVVYNPENRTSKALLSVDEFIYKCYTVCFYKESLVLL